MNILQGLSFEATKPAPAKKKGAPSKKAAISAKPYVSTHSISLDTNALKKQTTTSPDAPKPRPQMVAPVQRQNDYVVMPKSNKTIRMLPIAREEPVKRPKLIPEEGDDDSLTKSKVVSGISLTTYTGSPWLMYSTRIQTIEPTISQPRGVDILGSLSQEDAEESVTGFAVVIVNMGFDADNTHSSVVTMYEKKKQVPDHKSKLFLPALLEKSNIQLFLQRNGQTIRVSNADALRGKLIHGSVIGAIVTTIPNTTDCIIESIIYPTYHALEDVQPTVSRKIIARTQLPASSTDDLLWSTWEKNLIDEAKQACFAGEKPIIFLQDIFATTRPTSQSKDRICKVIEMCSALGTIVLIPGWNDPTLKAFPQNPFNPIIFKTTSINKVPVVYAPNPCCNFKDDDGNRYAWIEYDVLQLVHKVVFDLPIGTLGKQLADEGWNLKPLSIEMLEACLLLLLQCKHWCPLTPMFTVGSGASDQTPDALIIHELPHHILVFGCPVGMESSTRIAYKVDDQTSIGINIVFVSPSK